MNKLQWIATGSALLLFLVLWAGFDTKNEDQKRADRSRDIQSEPTSFAALLSDAKEHLTPEQAAQILESMNSAELRYIQENKKKPTQRPKKGLPDW